MCLLDNGKHLPDDDPQVAQLSSDHARPASAAVGVLLSGGVAVAKVYYSRTHDPLCRHLVVAPIGAVLAVALWAHG